MARSIARRRRQNVLLTLAAVVACSGLAWIGLDVQAARAVFFVAVIALGLYVYLLVMLRRAEEVRVGGAARTYIYSDAA
jgi:heme A synthase